MSRADRAVHRIENEHLVVYVEPSFGEAEERWTLTYFQTGSNMGSVIQPSIGDLDAAINLADHLSEVLTPASIDYKRLQEQMRVEFEQRRTEKDESERPAREAVAAARERELKGIADGTVEPERFEIVICDDCGHTGMPDDYEVPAYECSRCGQTLVGEDGRRCSDCNIFTAKTSSYSCPECEVPIEGEPVLVDAYRLSDGELVTITEAQAAVES